MSLPNIRRTPENGKHFYVFFAIPGLGGIMFAAYNIGILSTMELKNKLCWAFSFRDHSGNRERHAFFYRQGSFADYVREDIAFKRLGEWAAGDNDLARQHLSVTSGSELMRQYYGVRTLVIESPDGYRSAMLRLTSSFSDPEDLEYDGECLARPRIIGTLNDRLPTFAVTGDMNMAFLYDICDASKESLSLEPSRFTQLLEGNVFEGNVFEELPF